MELEQVMLLRQAHLLGTRLVDPKTGQLYGDSNLTASELSYKRDLVGPTLRSQLSDAQVVYRHVMKNRIESKEDNLLEEAETVWQNLLANLPEHDEEAKEGQSIQHVETYESGGSDYSHATARTRSKPKPSIDETLFQGLDEFMNRDEKSFLTELLTSGDAQSLAQAAMIMHGVLRLSMTGKHAAMSKQTQAMSKYEAQKHVDFIAKTKLSFPLPNHMPGYMLIPAFSSREGYMTLKDRKWDGSILPPQQSKRVFDQVYGSKYTPPFAEPRDVCSISAIRGPVGRVGLRKGDVITHVNDMAWTGTAKELQDYIYDCHSRHSQDNISLTVNANPETAVFLKLRNDMIRRSRGDALAASSLAAPAATST